MKTIARTLKVAALCGTLLTSAAFGANAKTADLFPKYKAGDTAQYTMNVNRSEKTEMPAQPSMSRVRTITHNATFKMEVVESSETSTTIALTLTGVNTKVQDPSKAMEFSSSAAPDDSDRDNQLIRAMRPAIGAKVQFKFDGKGNLITCTTDAKLDKASPYSLIAEQVVGEQWAKFRWSSVFFPKNGAGATNVGDKWTVTQSIETPSMGRFDSLLDFTLDAVSDKQADISAKGVLKLEPKPVTEAEKKADANADGKAVAKPPFDLKNSETSGNFNFNLATSMVTSAEWKEKVTLLVNAQGIEVSRESDTNVKISRTE